MPDPFIPYGRQSIDETDVEAVVAVLRSEWLTQGPSIERFEHDLVSVTGCHAAVAMSNATAALHAACFALGVGAGDWVWTSPNSFVASANCALYCGASVDFVDIDPVTLNMSPAALHEKLAAARSTGRLPKLVIPVHFAGEPCDMAAIAELSKEYGFHIVEDASHAVGALYEDRQVGSCAYSDITVFSFHPVKIVTTAEGGAALTNDEQLAQRLRLFRSHGVTRDVSLMERASEGPWYYEQVGLGYNYRLTDIQAALGSSQLRRLDSFISRRHELARLYEERLGGLPLTLPTRAPVSRSALHLFPVQLHDAGARRRVFDHLRSEGIGVNVHYIPIHLQPFYRARGFADADFPAAEDYYRRAISLPMHPLLDAGQLDRICASLKVALS